MKIAVIGAGAVGSLIVALLTKAGRDVILVGREHQVDEINANGIRISGVRGDVTIKVKAIPQLDQNYDCVIFATQSQDLLNAYQQNNEFLEESYCLPIQHGAHSHNILSAHFEREKMLSSIIQFGVTQINSSHIHFDCEGDWILGKPFLPVDPKVHKMADVLRSAFNVVILDDIVGRKWFKLLCDFHHCVPALVGKSLQETFSDEELCVLAIHFCREAFNVIQQAKIELNDLPNVSLNSFLGLMEMSVDNAAKILQGSMAHLGEEPRYGIILKSLKQGKRSEIDFFAGEIVSLGMNMRMKTPLCDTVLSMVHNIENGSDAFFSMEEVKERLKVSNLEPEQV